jgi:hypothetical protein
VADPQSRAAIGSWAAMVGAMILARMSDDLDRRRGPGSDDTGLARSAGPEQAEP